LTPRHFTFGVPRFEYTSTGVSGIRVSSTPEILQPDVLGSVVVGVVPVATVPTPEVLAVAAVVVGETPVYRARGSPPWLVEAGVSRFSEGTRRAPDWIRGFSTAVPVPTGVRFGPFHVHRFDGQDTTETETARARFRARMQAVASRPSHRIHQ